LTFTRRHKQINTFNDCSFLTFHRLVNAFLRMSLPLWITHRGAHGIEAATKDKIEADTEDEIEADTDEVFGVKAEVAEFLLALFWRPRS
jgi:hypothetical protein